MNSPDHLRAFRHLTCHRSCDPAIREFRMDFRSHRLLPSGTKGNHQGNPTLDSSQPSALARGEARGLQNPQSTQSIETHHGPKQNDRVELKPTARRRSEAHVLRATEDVVELNGSSQSRRPVANARIPGVAGRPHADQTALRKAVLDYPTATLLPPRCVRRTEMDSLLLDGGPNREISHAKSS